LVLAECEGRFYVLDVVRKQVAAPAFALTLKAHASQYVGSQMRWDAAGTERGAADFLVSNGIPITLVPATTDKYSRAQRVAAKWNAGEVLVPRHAPWVADFLREVQSFTGVGDYHDDQVDALSSAFLALANAITGQGATGLRRTSASLKGFY
jgi:predicted phage terminase large subunit-like protein